MEVTPELYAWLTDLNILSAEKTIKLKKDGKVFVDEEIVNNFLNGYYIDKILHELENLYNKFYKIKLTYTEKLIDIKILQDNIKNNKNDKNTRNAIWKIISQVTENFGIELNEEHIKKLTNGDVNALFYLLNSIYSLSGELMKRSPDKKGINYLLIEFFLLFLKIKIKI